MKKTINHSLSHDEITAFFSYDQKSGQLIWKQRFSNRTNIGENAGGLVPNGYIVIGIKGRRYYAHRIIWNYIYGDWPKGEIDHIDGNRANNTINNLRDVTAGINLQNRRNACPRNISGLLGAHKSRNKWSSHICINGKSHYLGCFNTPEEAHKAYVSAKRKLHHEGNTL